MRYDYGSDTLIQIRLIEEMVHVRENGFNLGIAVTNRSDNAFLLYGIKEVENGWWNGKGTYLEPDNGMGVVMFILSKTRNQIDFTVEDGILDKYERQNLPVPRDTIISRAYRNKLIVPPKSSVEFSISIISRKNARGEARHKLY